MQAVTRTQAGTAPDGSAVYETTWHSRARRPESLAEFLEQRIGSLGATRSLPAGRVAVQLLQAGDDDAAVRAAVAAGRDLGEHGQWGVLRTLELCRDKARSGYPPAAAAMDGLVRAWARKWGTAAPRMAG